MSEFVNLSTEGRLIVEKYLSGINIVKNIKKIKLIVSLYATLDDANEKVLGILNTYVINLYDNFTEAETKVLLNETCQVIRYCYERIEPDLGFTRPNDNHPLIIPDSLLELCNYFVSTNSDSDVYLPYTGAGQFAFKNPTCNYDGFERDAESWAISQIYLNSFGIKSDIKLTGNMHDALSKNKLYDIIFSFPPFVSGSEGRTVIDNLYHLATKSLKENGTMCCILPKIFCTSYSNWSSLRYILCRDQKEFSAAVISIPPMVFPFPLVDICLFLLCKDKQGKVLLVDATSDNFCARHDIAGNIEFELKVRSIVESITKDDEKFVWRGTTSDLIGENINLLPARYLLKQHLPQLHKGEKLLHIGELVDVVSTERNECYESHYPLLGFKELSFNYLNCDIRLDSIPLKPMDTPIKPMRSFKLLKDNCLIAGFIGGKFKVGRTVDLAENKATALRQELIPFKLRSGLITEDYLLRSIMSDIVSTQANIMASGAILSRIKKQDFLDLLIIVPPIEEQIKICKEDTKQSLTEAENKQKKTDDDFRRDMHMKRHAIGQTIFNLNNWWKALLRARKEGQGIVDDNAVIGKSYKVAVKDIYDNIQQVIDQLQQQISKFDRGNGLVCEWISLPDFIEDYIKKHKSPIFQFDYNAAFYHRIAHFGGKEVYDENGKFVAIEGGREKTYTFENALFAPEALTIVFDNIISNACSHGFAEREANPNDNIIKIEISTEGADHIISISNNGKPVREDVTEDYVFTYNKSTQNGNNHFGIGGYEVKHLMREFDGDAEFVSEPEKEFPVMYKLYFHSTKLELINLEE